MGTFIGGQFALARVSNRQCCCSATAGTPGSTSRRGSHRPGRPSSPSWHRPTRTPAAWPQRACACSLLHTSCRDRCRVGNWRGEVRRYGFHPDGRSDRILTCSNACCTAAFSAFMLRPTRRDCGDLQRRNRRPAADRDGNRRHQGHADSDGYGGDGSASPRLSPADRRIGAANRSGFSIKWSVTTASTKPTRAAVSLPANPSAWPKSRGANSRTGQCHRYHE